MFKRKKIQPKFSNYFFHFLRQQKHWVIKPNSCSYTTHWFLPWENWYNIMGLVFLSSNFVLNKISRWRNWSVDKNTYLALSGFSFTVEMTFFFRLIFVAIGGNNKASSNKSFFLQYLPLFWPVLQAVEGICRTKFKPVKRYTHQICMDMYLGMCQSSYGL